MRALKDSECDSGVAYFTFLTHKQWMERGSAHAGDPVDFRQAQDAKHHVRHGPGASKDERDPTGPAK